jgi:hypothetical protein
MDGLTKRPRRTRTHAASLRIVSARARARENTRVPIYMPGLCIDANIYIVHDVCVGYIYRRTYPRDANGRIVGARNRKHMRMRGGAAACTPIPISQTSTHVHRCICILRTHMYTYMHVSRLSYTQLYLHPWTPSHARAQTSAHKRASAHRRSRQAQRPAPHRQPAEHVPQRWHAAGPKRRRIPRTTW